MYVELIRSTRLLSFLGLYMGAVQLVRNVIYAPLVLCSSSFGTLVFLGIRRTTSAREEERAQEKGRRRTGGGEEEGRRRPGGGQEEGPHHPNPKVLLCGVAFSTLLYSILF